MTMVMDLGSGYLEKLLITPISRTSILLGKVMADAVRIAAQALVIIAIAYIMGVRINAGFGGVLLILLVVILFGLGMAGFSVAIALWTKNSESHMMLSIFVNMPLMFLSTAMMPAELLPPWMQTASRFNPVSHGVTSMRSLVLTGYDWPVIASSLAVLAAFAFLTLSISSLLFKNVSE